MDDVTLMPIIWYCLHPTSYNMNDRLWNTVPITTVLLIFHYECAKNTCAFVVCRITRRNVTIQYHIADNLTFPKSVFCTFCSPSAGIFTYVSYVSFVLVSSGFCRFFYSLRLPYWTVCMTSSAHMRSLLRNSV